MTIHTRPAAQAVDRLARPKGRSSDPGARNFVRAVIGDAPLQRDLLIEYLHRLQDQVGHLAVDHLVALAAELRAAPAEVFEVASFYTAFRIVKEGEPPPSGLRVKLCTSVSCALAGADDLLAALRAGLDPAAVEVEPVSCLGRCGEAPAALVGETPVAPATAGGLLASCAMAPPRGQGGPATAGLEAYREAGGYRLLAAVRSGARSAESIVQTLSDAGLRGLGGAGFPAGRKWAAVRAQPGPRLMTINADEGEPGTFKDRHLLAADPHRVLEGALVAAAVVGCARIYLYLRDEYPEIRALLAVAIAEAATVCPTIPIELRRGAGAYICGEESAMLESIEGKRGLPRHRPPFIAERGLFGRPTLNHNVETLYFLREILEGGADAFAAQGVRGAKGVRHFSVSGRVARPGVVRAPAGSTARELIAACGGMVQGHRLAGFLPGGASGGMLPASAADEPLDFGTLDRFGCFVGSHAVVVFSDADDPKAIARNLMAFFAHESCGQCTPCRAGTVRMGEMIAGTDWDADALAALSQVMRDASICGLGQAAPNPVLAALRFFGEGPR